jgi:hypothetical protein
LIFLISINAFAEVDYFEQSAGEGTNNELIQVFEYYRENPIDLNTATINQLSILPFFNSQIAQKIIKLREDHKPKTIKELISVGDFDERSEYIIENCISIEKSKGFAADFRARIIDRFQNLRGFRDSSFLGSPLDLFSRARVAYNNYELNIAQNKNAGENDFLQTSRISIAYNSQSTKLFIGDQKIKRGLGLALSNGFALRKNPQSTSGFNNYGEGLLPSRSIFEFARFRGIGVQKTFQLKNIFIEPIAYYYNTQRPATINDEGNISSLYLTGLFRTENEIQKSNAYDEELYGGGLELKYLDNIIIGFNSYRFDMSDQVVSESFRYFEGNSGNINSAYLFFNRDFFHFSGEIVSDANRNTGVVANTNLLAGDLEFLIAMRYLEPGLRLQYSNVITESSVNSNEQGLYLGIEYKKKDLINNFYVDVFESLRPFDDYFIESGFEILDDVFYKINKGNINLRFRHENKSFLEPDDNRTEYSFTNRSRTSMRIELNKSLEYKIDARFRVEYAYIDFQDDFDNEKGIQAFVEIKKEIFKGFRSGLRYTFYDTDSFESAIWHFEFLVPGYMISPPLYLQGNKFLGFVNYKIGDFSFWLRYTRDKRAGVEELGSGRDRINGNIDERFYFQVDWRFR